MRWAPGLLLILVVLSIGLVPQPSHALKALSGTITTNTVLDTVGGRIYNVTGTVTVNNGVTLTIDPGVVLKFDIGKYMIVHGKLLAVGGSTADSTITFTSIRDDNAPAPGGDDTNGDGNATVPANHDWYYIQFTDASNDSSTFKHCIIRYGGRGSMGMVLCDDASPTIEDCDLSAAYYGVQCRGVSKPVLRNTSINAMTDVPIAIEISSNPVFDNLAFGSSSDNGFDAIGLLGGTLSGPNILGIRGATIGVSPIPNLVYIVLSDITIAGGGSLKVDPGVVCKPKDNVDIFVNGTLTMDGTSDPDSQIVFTSFKDDNYGDPSDTNNDGSTTAPAVSDWGQIEFNPASSGSISYAVIKFGGYSTEGMVRTLDVSPPVSNCEISDTYFGIEQAGLAASSIQNNTVSNCTYTPILMSVSADPTFSGNTFTNNGLTALGIIGETIAIDSVIKVRTVAGYDNITYWLENQLTMAQNTHLRVEPGVVIKVRASTAMVIEGSLQADATGDSAIVFTSQYDDAVGNPQDTEGNGTATSPAAKNWAYIYFASTAIDGNCVMDSCLVSYGGYWGGGAYSGVVWCASSSPTITNCDFRTNGTGIRTDGSAAPLIQDNNFFNSSEVPLATSVVAAPDYVDNTFDQNVYHVVGILSETLSQDARLERIQVGGPPQFSELFPYLHLGTLTIGSGATLTVDPGVVVKVLSGNPVTVNGGLSMVGTSDPDSQIVYTDIKDDSHGGDSNVDGSSSSPTAGDWTYILFNSTTIDTASALEYCLFRFGGNGAGGVVNLQSASPTIRNCEFELNNWALWIQNASDPTVEDNLFRLTTYAPISKSILAVPTFSANTYDNNGYDVLGLIGEPIAQDLTLHKWDVAGYTNITRALVSTTLDIDFGATLTIDPGVVLKMGLACCGPFASSITIDGAVRAEATEPEPIVFTSIRDDTRGNPLDSNNDGSITVPTEGDWRDIEFRDVSTDTSNVFEWCEFYYGGYSGAWAVDVITASPTFRNCTFQDNSRYGIVVRGDSKPTIDSCVFGGHSYTPIVMSLVSDPTFHGNVFETTNGYTALGIFGETLASDVLWKRRCVAGNHNIPYVLVSSLTAGLSSILRIEPGVVIKPLSGVNITAKRGLIAEGKADPESLIVFTSPRDDFYGGDTNNDSTATDGSSYRWGRIQIDNEVVDDSTRFDYCVFRYSQNSTTYGALNITNAHPEISNSIFNQCGIGVNLNGASGDSLKGKIEYCDIFDNINYGVKNTGMSFVVSAKNCWWGHASGPYDPSDDTGSGGFYNPGGLGDGVTDGVDYSGWKTGGVGNLLIGDVSLNGEVRAYDASLVLQHLAQHITLTAQQQTVGDVNCESGLSTLDASYILQYVAGLISFFPCALDTAGAPCLPPQLIALGPGAECNFLGDEPGHYRVSIPAFECRPGQQTVIPIEVSGSGELLGHEYRIAFDPKQLRVDDVRLSDAARDAVMAWNVVDAGGSHELVIALASMNMLPVEKAVDIVATAKHGLRGGDRLALDFRLVRFNEQDLTDVAISEGGRAAESDLPQRFTLAQNYPNPFNPMTTIRYDIPAEAGANVHVLLTIFDVRGSLVRTLVNRSDAPGSYEAVWNGKNDSGQSVGTGMYFYRIEAGPYTATRKMLLIK